MAGTLSRLGCEPTIIGRFRGECCRHGVLKFRTHRFRMLFRKGFMFYASFNIRLFLFLVSNKFDLYVANDLDTLLPCYLAARLKRKRIVYDSHEYFTGVPELNDRHLVRSVWKMIEKAVFPNLEHVITVSEPIAEKYFTEYKIRPAVVRNCPERSLSEDCFTRHELSAGNDDLVLILQGTGINADRGGEELVMAVGLTKKVFLIVIGTGDVIDKMKMLAREKGVSGRIRFLPPADRETLMKYTRSADAGLTLDKDTSDNYRWSLPNKLFDYIGAGIPVIASNLPEVRKITDTHRCGIIVSSVSPEGIAASIKWLQDNPSGLAELKGNAARASKELTWEHESTKVIELYSKVLGII